MFTLKRYTSLLCSTIFIVLLLAACGSNTNTTTEAAAVPSAAAPAQTAEPAAAAGDTRSFTDGKGRQIDIPVHPQRIVYIGSDPGDLLALDVKPIGASLSVIGTQVAYPDLLEGIEDIGYPPSLEKIVALDPDLILFNDWDESGIESAAAIAPTAVIDEGGTYERLKMIAAVLGKEDIADQKIAEYETKAAAVKDQLKLDLGSGDTATIYLQLGKTLYVMGHQGISVSLYDMLGFKPSSKVQEMIDKDERFAEISAEVLAEYAGDEVFVLGDETAETSAAVDELMEGAIWNTIPAVKSGHVYVTDSKWNFDDLITRTRLLEELPVLMSK
ncbi:Iron(3+)-hydroxamate-binding protein FhuD precursor [compost metagenome]